MDFDAKYAWINKIMEMMRLMIKKIKEYFGIQN